MSQCRKPCAEHTVCPQSNQFAPQPAAQPSPTFTIAEIDAAMKWAGAGGLIRGPVRDRLRAIHAARTSQEKSE